MKIICEKGYDVKKVLQLVSEYLEKKSLEYPLLGEDMEIEISLKNADGETCPDNNTTVCFGEKEIELVQDMDELPEYYYNNDVLTGLYNRSKYERDVIMLQATGYVCLSCVYIDVVGLHEVNNHLGHEAGDRMLCSIAKGILKYFPNSLSYRIGGDEFVVLCPGRHQDEVAEKISLLKQAVQKLEYEISVGIGESTDSRTLHDTINFAENSMRYDKMVFYRNNGGIRQMRSLNHKLEKLLLEKQDANYFLNVIAPRYKGVYMVNTRKDTCRYIYIPSYFQEMLNRNNGAFLPALKEYYRTLVRPEYHDRFETLCDYDYVRECLSASSTVDFTYQKVDGLWIELKITVYEQDSLSGNSDEMLWIFLDESGHIS